MKHAEQVRNKHVRAQMWKVVYRYNISTIRGLPLSTMYARVTQRPQTDVHATQNYRLRAYELYGRAGVVECPCAVLCTTHSLVYKGRFINQTACSKAWLHIKCSSQVNWSREERMYFISTSWIEFRKSKLNAGLLVKMLSNPKFRLILKSGHWSVSTGASYLECNRWHKFTYTSINYLL